MRDRYTNNAEPGRRNDIYYELLGIMLCQWFSLPDEPRIPAAFDSPSVSLFAFLFRCSWRSRISDSLRCTVKYVGWKAMVCNVDEGFSHRAAMRRGDARKSGNNRRG